MNDSQINLQVENNLDYREFRDVLIRSGLSERRPTDDQGKMTLMCRHANLIITARIDGLLIGVARSLTDFAFCTYLSDLAVDRQYQRQGIGKNLIQETFERSKKVALILVAAPGLSGYYRKIGMSRIADSFLLMT